MGGGALKGNTANSLACDLSHSEEVFQELLLELSHAAVQCSDPSQLILSFCRLTRSYFRSHGTYYWKRFSDGDLVGAEADGASRDHFRGMRLCAGDAAIAVEAARTRTTVVRNQIDKERDPQLAAIQATSAMAVPLLISGELAGVIMFVHETVGSHVDEDSVAKANVLSSQLGTALEALRLRQLSDEERRRAMILVETATALHGLPDTSAVMEGIADRLRVLLHAPIVLIFVQEGDAFQLRASAATTSSLAGEIASRFQAGQLRSAIEIASRAVSARERIAVSIGSDSHFGDHSPAGVLIAAPFRTSRAQGAVLVYPRASNPFTHEEKTIVSALAGFGAVAVANAELYGMARAQAQELQEILEISSALGTAGKLDRFMQTSVVRAANFLGFERCFAGMLEQDRFHVRWGFDKDGARPVDIPLHDGVATRALLAKEVFVTDDASKTPGANLEFVGAFGIRQLLAVPLLGSNGEVLGMFGVLDPAESGPIDAEDVRRARALAAQIAMALELTRNLHQAEQHRRRAEALVSVALEWNTVRDLPEFSRKVALRVSDLLGGSAVALSLGQSSEFETLMLAGGSAVEDLALLRRFNQSLGAALAKYSGDVVFAPAAELLGEAVAGALSWKDCTLVRVVGPSEKLSGVLCLANRSAGPSAEDQQLLRALAGHAGVALENASLFTRLQQASQHWLEIFDAISDFIVVHDQQHQITRVNRSLADFMGLAPDDLIGVSMRALEGLASGMSPHACPFCRSGDGLDEYVHAVQERTYLVSTSRIHAASAQPMQTVHVLKDITDRREAERRYRELFDNIQEGIFFSTPQGRFVEVNDALVRMLGYTSRDEVLNLDIPTQVYYSSERRTELAMLLERQGGLSNQEEILRRKDGSPVHVLINCFGMRDAHGQVLQYRGLMLDITGLRHSQVELQRERDFSGKVLNHTQSLILVTGVEGTISYANRRWAGLGFQQEQLLGRPLLSLTAPARREALRHALESVARGQQVDNFELPLLRADGAVGQFSVNLSPISSEDGPVTSVVVVMTDVTDSAMLQAKLMHAEKMAAVGQLVSGVAHEVNNPLTAILGFTDLLVENPDLPESVHRDLRVILQEAQRTKQIVQNLLSFARQMPPQRLSVQLNSILRRTVQLRAYDFHSHGIEVAEHFDDAMPEIVGDSHQLQQVFLNILNNAYDAVRESGRKPRIEITSARSADWVEVSFRDNGMGIRDPERIFDPFFTTKEVGKGTGLGLSICYGIVREHGGEIICYNNPDSEGATFVVRLPIASEVATFGAVAGVFPK
jgi:two-component system NtrC family sensor kinase